MTLYLVPPSALPTIREVYARITPAVVRVEPERAPVAERADLDWTKTRDLFRLSRGGR